MNRTTPDKAGAEARDTAQFVRLLTQNERRVYAFILSQVPNWFDADEILQDTNVRLWEEFGRFEPGTDFCAWACTVAKFQVLTHRKRRSRERGRVNFTDEFLDVVAAEMGREGDDLAAARHRALERCVERLNPAGRAMVKAYYRPGAAGGEVAEQFGRSVDALYKALSRIRKTLHDCIQARLKAQVDG